jgi:hypothetical protein
MAAAAVPLTGRSLLGKAAVALHALARMKKKEGPSRLAVFITDHIGTVAALGLVDAGLWHWSDIAGFIGAGVCVLVAELKIRG